MRAALQVAAAAMLRRYPRVRKCPICQEHTYKILVRGGAKYGFCTTPGCLRARAMGRSTYEAEEFWKTIRLQQILGAIFQEDAHLRPVWT